MSIRTQQIESTLQRAISQLVATQLGDPRIVGLVSVTRVQISPDLHNAFVYVSVLPAKHEKTTVHGLQSAAPRIRMMLRKSVRMRAIPQLEFRLDQSIKKEADILGAIHQAIQREKRAPDEVETSEATQAPPEDQPR